MFSSVACKVLILYSICIQASGLPYHKKPAQFVPPKDTTNVTSYFGFSMAYYPYTKSLMISAPTENDIGVLYTCDLNTQHCSEVKHHESIKRYPSYTHDYWLGATVRAAEDFVVTCAPRYTATLSGFSQYGTFGHCFYLNKNNSILYSMRDADIDQRKKDTKKFEENMDSLGWSLDISPSDSITVGGPAMFTGRALSYKRQTSQPFFLQNGDRKKDSGSFNGARFNFGYSVASGLFINEDQIAYAVGSPYGQQGYGMVLFYESLDDLQDDKFIKMSDKMLKSNVVGSMYGAVLCAAKLSGIGNDLIVGAPAYAGESKATNYNLGAVFIYVYSEDAAPLLKKVLKGSTDGGMFGSAIISVGDLNGDGLDEIVIAAPYVTEDQGSVYIYSGADLASDEPAVTIKILQQITSEKGAFGLSLAAIGDFDDNGCKELAVAAPTNNVVKLYKCFASVTVKLSATFPTVSHTPGIHDNYFLVCLNVEYPEKPKTIIADLLTQVKMIHPNAKLTGVGTDGIFKFKVSLKDKQSQYCQNVRYDLPANGNYDIRVGYNVTSELLNNPYDLEDFDPARVVLSDRSEVELSDSILAAACPGPGGCIPKLTLNLLSSMSEPYKIGTNAIEKYSITNTGDVAYDTCLQVTVVGTFVAHWPTACHKGICSPRGPLKTNDKWDMGDLELEMTGLSNQNREIKLNVKLYDHCTKRNQYKPYDRVIPLFADPQGIHIKGENSVIDMTATQMKYQGKQLEHIYKIISDGTVQWEGLQCEFAVEKNNYYSYGNISTEAGNTAPKCQKTEEADYIKFHCTLSKITDKNKIMTLLLPISVVAGIYDDFNGEQNRTLHSNFSLFFDEVTKTASMNPQSKDHRQTVTTTIRLQEGKVPWWMILCAVILGLFLLILFIMAMRECGLFRRKNKTKLENLKRSVNRQTIRRSMMNTKEQTPQEDQLQILEDIDE